MSIIAENTNSHTPAETSPVITADNFAEIVGSYTTRMTTREIIDQKDKLQCSIANCDGHGGGELLDTWEELTHVVQYATLAAQEIGLTGYNEGNISLNRRGDEEFVYYYSYFEGELRVDQLDGLIAQLKATVAAVESFQKNVEASPDN